MATNVLIAIGLAVGLTLLIAIIEILFQSKLRNVRLCCCTMGFVFYVLVLIIGNVASTLVAHSLVTALVAQPAANPSAGTQPAAAGQPADKPGVARAVFASVPWFWAAFLGVFAFEAILQRINLTFFDKGVLTISDWISKARDGAVAAAVKSHATALVRRERQLADRIAGNTNLTDQDLNAHVHNVLGAGRVQELEQAAAASSANPRLIKALALAAGDYDRASTLA
jgi:hypothetical protein